jgi:serine/threonine protein kinase
MLCKLWRRFKRPHLISEEATSKVWGCWDAYGGREVVLKVPKKGCKQTVREAELIGKLSHPNIMRVEETVETPNGPACVYEAASSDLYEWLKYPMSEEEVKEIGEFRVGAGVPA